MPAAAPTAGILFGSICVPQADGSYLVKPGKPLVTPDEIPVRVAAKILGLSTRRVIALIEEGVFRSANQPAGHKRRWLLSRAEVIARKENGFLVSRDAFTTASNPAAARNM
ncbi:MAG: helix-turn-helix domain-containing protein [Verrucomicrobia bacterium]|nr:helix-turn-helix domain-containing protein [Verrucomicrobiota bacterium]